MDYEARCDLRHIGQYARRWKRGALSGMREVIANDVFQWPCWRPWAVTENELNELAELLRELEETLVRLKVAKDPARRRLLLRKLRRLFAEIEPHPIRAKLSHWI